jgi:hypothetical protein
MRQVNHYLTKYYYDKFVIEDFGHTFVDDCFACV